MEGVAEPQPKTLAPLAWIAVWGPGLLVMLADTDAGNVVTGAQAGAQWGYRLLPLLLLLIPMLYMVQELTVRLGIATGRGHGELIRERFGLGWACLSTAGLAAAAVGSLITEFTGVAGIGELYGLSRSVTLPFAAAALLAVVATGSYRRVERDRDRHRPVRTRLLRRRLGGAPERRDARRPGARPAARRPRLPLSRRGGDRRDLQSLDDLLSAVRHRR